MLPLGFTAFLAFGVVLVLLGASQADLAEALSLDLARSGLLGSVLALGIGVGVVGAGPLFDRYPRRHELARRSARRLGLKNLRCEPRDALRPLRGLSETPFDRVLVDVPCSGLGTLRRNPDARWRVGPDDPARLAEIQRQILANAAECLRPGGVLVYSTCTVLHEENQAVVESFLSSRDDFVACPASRLPEEVRDVVGSDGYLHTLPHLHDMDGFFAARLVRRT